MAGKAAKPGTEWYEPHKKNVVICLKKAKAASKEQAVPVALVKNKDGSFAICAGMSKVKMVNDGKKAGAKVISEGILYDGDGKPTFEVQKGDASVKVKFAAAAAEVLGSAMMVNMIKAADAKEMEEAEGEEEGPKPVAKEPAKEAPKPVAKDPAKEAPKPVAKDPAKEPGKEPVKGSAPPGGPKGPPTAPGKMPAKPPAKEPPKETPESKAFDGRVAAINDQRSKATVTDAEVDKSFKLKLSEASVFSRKGEYQQANKLLDEATALIRPFMAAPKKEPPKKAAPKEVGPMTPDDKGFATRTELVIEQRKAKITDPAIAKSINLKVSEANMYGRKGEYEPACKLLDEALALLKPFQVQKPETEESEKSESESSEKSEKTDPKKEAPKKPTGAPPIPPDEQGYKMRLTNTWLKNKINDPEIAKRVRVKMDQAQQFADRQQYAPACKIVDEVLAILKPLQGKAPAGDKGKSGDKAEPKELSEASLKAWQTARTDAIKQIDALSAAIEKTGDEDAIKAASELSAIEKKLTEKPATLKEVRDLERYVRTDELLLEAETVNPFGVRVKFRAGLLSALKTLVKELT